MSPTIDFSVAFGAKAKKTHRCIAENQITLQLNGYKLQTYTYEQIHLGQLCDILQI